MKRVLALVLGTALCSACALRQVGKSIGEGLMEAVNVQGPTVAEGLIRGAGEGLRKDVLNEATGDQLANTVSKAGDAALAKVPELRDQALGTATQEQVRQLAEALLVMLEARSQQTSRVMMREVGDGIRQEILNEATRVQLAALVEALGGTARGQTKLMRDEMLGTDTNKQVQVLVEGAMGAVVDGTERIRRQAREELSFMQRNTAESVLVIGAVAGLALWWVWHQKEKNRILLNLLTQQLHEVTKSKVGDEVFVQIQQQAHEVGVEQQLRRVLAQLGLGQAPPPPKV